MPQMFGEVEEDKKKKINELLQIWRDIVKEKQKSDDGHYDFTGNSEWLVRIKGAPNLIRNLESKNLKEEDIEEVVRKVFTAQKFKSEESPEYDFFTLNVRMIGTLIDLEETKKKDLRFLKKILEEVKDEKKFKESWVEAVYNLLKERRLLKEEEKKNKLIKTLITHRLSEMHFWLHPESSPMYNGCSKKVLRDILDKKDNYRDYEEFFEDLEKFKELYLGYLGRVADQNKFSIYTELDQFFNYFDKSEEGQEIFEKWKANKIIPQLEKGKVITDKKIKAKNMILYGPPGTGKTYITKQKALEIIREKKCDEREINKKFEEYKNNGQIEFITFHPSYCYEDFVEGIRPELEEGKSKEDSSKNEAINFELKEGIFKKICARALWAAIKKEIKSDVKWKDAISEFKNFLNDKKLDYYEDYEEIEKIFDSAAKFVLIIDEINRGDISKIFGELITLIEEDKRIGSKNKLITTLPYSREDFGIPSNLYIIGTMNTADRSLALVDIALRRRFVFEEMKPILDELKENPEKFGSEKMKSSSLSSLFNKSIDAIKNLNKKLGNNPDIGKDKKIGHAFLCNVENEGEILHIWKNKILPLIEEYYFFDKKQLEEISGGLYTSSEGWRNDSYKVIEQVIEHFSKLNSEEETKAENAIDKNESL